jgi:hypothetical protein
LHEDDKVKDEILTFLGLMFWGAFALLAWIAAMAFPFALLAGDIAVIVWTLRLLGVLPAA